VLKNLINLFFPQICEACKTPLQDNENSICISCRHELPVTNFHFENNDVVKKLLYGRLELENAMALLHFSKKGLVQVLLHNLKYRGHEQIGKFLGDWLGGELKTIETYQTIDVVVPVPTHKKSKRERGYNQVTKFGQQIAKALDVDYYDDALIKTSHTKRQVFKDRVTRFEDVNKRFEIGNTVGLYNKHILLVDDVITTSATIEACGLLLQTIPGVKISVATMAIVE
jgi:ComF family protein